MRMLRQTQVLNNLPSLAQELKRQSAVMGMMVSGENKNVERFGKFAHVTLPDLALNFEVFSCLLRVNYPPGFLCAFLPAKAFLFFFAGTNPCPGPIQGAALKSKCFRFQ